MPMTQVLQEISKDLEANDGILNDAWVMHEGKRWHPAKIRDRASGKHGFDVNFSGQWGPNALVGRRKLTLEELLRALAYDDLPEGSTIRCKPVHGRKNNGRNTAALQFSPRLLKLIAGMRGDSRANGVVEPSSTTNSERGQGYARDVVYRRLIEQHAISRALEFYKEYQVTVAGAPYDLECQRGDDTFRVEVKGTTTAGSSVFLTAGEVRHARESGVRMELFVVSHVQIEVQSDGSAKATGGRERVWRNWMPEDSDLEAIEYRYRLPLS